MSHAETVAAILAERERKAEERRKRYERLYLALDSAEDTIKLTRVMLDRIERGKKGTL